MSKPSIMLVHGAGRKPEAQALQALWVEALAHGLKRDGKLAKRLQDTDIALFHYADTGSGKAPTNTENTRDLQDRKAALKALRSRGKAKDFRRRYYEELPAKSAMGEFVADLSASVGLGRAFLKRRVPDLHAYLEDEDHARSLRERMVAQLQHHLNTPTLIVAHCLGSVIAFEALSALAAQHSVTAPSITLLTLGSPLASRSVRSTLRARELTAPLPLQRWSNVAAEDDFICHDKSMHDDYQHLIDDRLIEHIEDFPIYNLSVRDEQSNPHHAAGYLIHPRTAQLVGDWLREHT